MMKSDKSPKLKRRSTRHVSEVTAIASEFGNSAKIIVPRGWLGRRVIAFLHSADLIVTIDNMSVNWSSRTNSRVIQRLFTGLSSAS